MAQKTVNLGSMENFHAFDDGDTEYGMETDAKIKVGTAPAVNDEVVRLQDITAPGDGVSAGANLTDHAIIRGEGGAKAVQDSNVFIDDVGNITIGIGAAGVDYAVLIDGENSDGTLIWMEDEQEWRISGNDAANYLAIKTDGSIEFNGTARIDWRKWTADSVTLAVGGAGGSVVADLQTAHDGNIYSISEVAATPAIDLIVDFVNVTALNWIKILAYYDGASTHSVSIMVYNWNTTAWDTFDSLSGVEKTIVDHSIWLPDDTNYIGTGGNLGDVRVRFDHTMNGNNSHDLYIDVVALYQ